MGLSSWKQRGRRAVAAAALTAIAVAGTAGWASGQEQRPLTGPPRAPLRGVRTIRWAADCLTPRQRGLLKSPPSSAG